MQSIKDHIFFITLIQCWTVPSGLEIVPHCISVWRFPEHINRCTFLNNWEPLDGSQLSGKWHLVIWQYCLYPLTGCPSLRQLSIMLNRPIRSRQSISRLATCLTIIIFKFHCIPPLSDLIRSLSCQSFIEVEPFFLFVPFLKVDSPGHKWTQWPGGHRISRPNWIYHHKRRPARPGSVRDHPRAASSRAKWAQDNFLLRLCKFVLRF